MMLFVIGILILIALISVVVTGCNSSHIDNIEFGLIYIPGICMILSVILGIIYFVGGV